MRFISYSYTFNNQSITQEAGIPRLRHHMARNVRLNDEPAAELQRLYLVSGSR